MALHVPEQDLATRESSQSGRAGPAGGSENLRIAGALLLTLRPSHSPDT